MSTSAASSSPAPAPSSDVINPSQIPAGVHAIAGAFGGIASLTVTYPLFSLVTRMAMQSKADNTRKSAAATFAEIVKNEGVQGLFSGINSALLGTAVAQYVYYYWYELLRSIFSGNGKRVLSISENLLVGSIAGAVTATATNPIWLVNARMSTSKDKTLTSLGCLQQLIAESGYAGLFNGVGPSLILVSNPVIQYGAYEQMKVWWEGPAAPGKKPPALTAFQVFLLGAIAKAIATVATYPLQIVKTKLFVQKKDTKQDGTGGGGAAGAGGAGGAGGGFFAPLIDLYQKEGMAGFFNGLETKITQSVLTAAFLFMFKDQFLIFTVKLLRILAPSMLVMTDRK